MAKQQVAELSLVAFGQLVNNFEEFRNTCMGVNVAFQAWAQSVCDLLHRMHGCGIFMSWDLQVNYLKWADCMSDGLTLFM